MNKLIKCALFLLVTQLAACNTISGMGDDIKKSAEWTKEKMTPIEVVK
jgi:predicted small secreted protein